MILYPTETVYGLGVNAIDAKALAKLYDAKGRAPEKPASWLVRDIADIERYAIVSDVARELASRFLPGPLTLVLPARNDVPREFVAAGGTISFRISRDPLAQQLINEFMATNDAPLTATSANVSGEEPATTPKEILAQFGERADAIERVIDDGPRAGVPSTVVYCDVESCKILREGAIAVHDIWAVLR